MNKSEMILGIIEIFDTAEHLVHEVNRLEAEKANSRRTPIKNPDETALRLNYLDSMMLSEGQEHIYAESVYSLSVMVAVKECDGKVTPFETWRERKVYSIPDFMSRDDFYSYFDVQLRRDYEREKSEAIARIVAMDEEDV